MSNDDCNRVYKLIEDKYYEMKRNFSIAYRKSTGKNFNEDVYHNTLISCSKTIKDSTASDVELMKYIYNAFRINMSREKQYARNKYTTLTDKLPELLVYDNVEYYDIIDSIRKYIISHYDEKTYDECYEWVMNNKSVREIEEEYNDTKLTYKFKKIKNEIIKFFGEDLHYFQRNNIYN